MIIVVQRETIRRARLTGGASLTRLHVSEGILNLRDGLTLCACQNAMQFQYICH